jgi:hypothetical protein
MFLEAKAFLRGNFTAIGAYIKRTERSQINYPIIHLNLLEKQEQEKAKTSRRREIINRDLPKNDTKNQENKKLVL